MLTLDLTNAPRWHELAPGVRAQLRPLTTALMVATRSDPAVEAVPEKASDEERAVAFAKALARRAVLAWEGIGDAGVCQRSCPPVSCGVSYFRGADFGFGVEPDRSGGLPVAGFA
jgi:hypothetical protein